MSNNTDFEKFIKLLKTFEYDEIPQEPYECSWKIDSYRFCQFYLKRFRISPDVLEIISKFISIEKYYWTTVIMFPDNYFGYERGNSLVKIQDLTSEEKDKFQKQMENMVKTVYENQKNLGYNLEGNYLDVCNNIFENMISIKK
jgi:hypothetical protein